MREPCSPVGRDLRYAPDLSSYLAGFPLMGDPIRSHYIMYHIPKVNTPLAIFLAKPMEIRIIEKTLPSIICGEACGER
jgi:hypothetical protein